MILVHDSVDVTAFLLNLYVAVAPIQSPHPDPTARFRDSFDLGFDLGYQRGPGNFRWHRSFFLAIREFPRPGAVPVRGFEVSREPAGRQGRVHVVVL